MPVRRLHCMSTWLPTTPSDLSCTACPGEEDAAPGSTAWHCVLHTLPLVTNGRLHCTNCRALCLTAIVRRALRVPECSTRKLRLVCKACAFGQHALMQNSSSCESCFTSYSSDGKCMEAIAVTAGAMLFMILYALLFRCRVSQQFCNGGRQKLMNEATAVYSASGELRTARGSFQNRANGNYVAHIDRGYIRRSQRGHKAWSKKF